MRFYFLFFITSYAIAQQNTIDWITANKINIEDANPNSELITFHNNLPEKFAKATIYGFGEATHHGKEFFDLKAKFFKYLVEHQNVKLFIMEESYQAESAINEWISGGKGDAETIADNFSIVPWHCKEVVDLLAWMRNFNLNKSKEEQIRFYGIDVQIGTNINTEVRDFIQKYKIPVDNDLLAALDDCAAKKFERKGLEEWAEVQIPKLQSIEATLIDFQTKAAMTDSENFKSVIRALNYLMKYSTYLGNPRSDIRDLKMFENTQWILAGKAENKKAFIWAHNEHVNNKELYSLGSQLKSLGGHLKEKYKNDYYSVGFDFGAGTLRSVIMEKGKPIGWTKYKINEPFRKTYAETLFKVNTPVYFIDLENAIKNDSSNFFAAKNRQLILGGPGFNPKKYYLIKKRYSEMFDGLIFINEITVPNYQL